MPIGIKNSFQPNYALQNLGNDGVAGKTLRWSVLSESPSSCAAKGGSYAGTGSSVEHFCNS